MLNTDMMDIKSHILKYYGLILVCFSVFLSGCSSWKTPASAIDDEPLIFPDYKDVTVPCNISPLNFMIDGAGRIQAMICMEDQEVIRLSGKDGIIRIPEKKWHDMLSVAKGSDITVSVSAWTDQYPEGVTYKSFKVHVAPDEIDPWISYRLIEPGYIGWRQMGIYQREISSFDEYPIVTNRHTNTTCINCHHYQAYSPESMMFHARGAEGGTIIYVDGELKKIDFKNIGPKKNTTYPAWHPKDRYIAFSSNSTFQVFYGEAEQPIEVYDTASDLVLYDVLTGEVLTDPRFMTDDKMETFPAWSPDGGYLYYVAAPHKELPAEIKEMHYSLYRVPFYAESGTFGEDIELVYDATSMGGSVSYPRVSADGRYLLYTLSQYGTFPVWHPEADLKMIDLVEKKPIDVSLWNHESEADSYHSWSSDGRWVVFGSRRLDGRYTRLFIAYFDKDANPHKPLLLPQEDPRHNLWRMKSFNVPEFTRDKVELPEEAAELFYSHK